MTRNFSKFAKYGTRVIDGKPEQQCKKCSKGLNLLIGIVLYGWFCLNCDEELC